METFFLRNLVIVYSTINSLINKLTIYIIEEINLRSEVEKGFLRFRIGKSIYSVGIKDK